MTENVTHLHTPFKGDLPVSIPLEGALKADLASVIVIGESEDGSLYLASSSGSIADLNLLLDLVKREILAQSDA